MSADPMADLARVIGAALVAATDRDELRRACEMVARAGERVRAQFGSAVCCAALAALHEHSIRPPTPDPLAAAESVFVGKHEARR